MNLFLFAFINLFGLPVLVFRSLFPIIWFVSLFSSSFLSLDPIYLVYSILFFIFLVGISFIRTNKFNKSWGILNVSLGVFIICIINQTHLNHTNNLGLEYENRVVMGLIMIGWHVVLSQFEWSFKKMTFSKKPFNNRFQIHQIIIYSILLIFVSWYMCSEFMFINKYLRSVSFQYIYMYLFIWLFGFYLQRKIQLKLIRIDFLWNLILMSVLSPLKIKELEFNSTYVSAIHLACLISVIKNLLMLPPVYAPIKKEL